MDASKKLTLADIMSRRVKYVSPGCELGDAVRLMSEAKISSLLVVEEGRPQGILTERDLLHLMSKRITPHTPVSQIMSSPVLTASADLSFTAAYAQVLNHKIRHLVVVDETGMLAGVVSETDFRNHLAEDLLSRLDDLHAVMEPTRPHLLPEDKLARALEAMLLSHTSYALVVENGRAIGIVTERDMATLLSSGVDAEEVSLRAVMHEHIVSANYHTPVFEMAGLMRARNLRHLVVVDEDGLLIGMVTLHKLMERIAATVLNEQTLRHQEVLENSKQRAESMLRSIVQTIPDLVWLKGIDGLYLSCNRMFERLFGTDEANIVGKSDYEFLSREQADSFRAYDRRVIETLAPCINEEWVTFADGKGQACLEITSSPLLDACGKLIGVLGVAHDITQHRAAAAKIQRLTQLYNVLSQCNQAIVRCKDKTALFDQICRDTVQYGGVRMAWIGMLDGNILHPAASYGEGVLFTAPIDLQTDADRLGAVAVALREGRPVWGQKDLEDAWRVEAARSGWSDSACLPLLHNGVVVGVFALYTAQSNAFDADAQRLLLEMATDISFALDNFERELGRLRLETQSENERSVLELLARGRPLPVLLDHLTLSYEKMFTGMFCSVLLLTADGLRLEHGSAPSLPEAYCKEIDGVAIGPAVGSCGTAAYTRQTVIVSDIAHDPLWAPYAALAAKFGLAACWSVPVISTQNKVLGTFAMYHKEPRAPHSFELDAIARGAHLASLAIERAQTEAWLNKLSQAVEQSPSTIVITDLDANFEYVNKAFTDSTGYSLDEVLGRNQRIVQSGKTPRKTYQEMWAKLTAGEKWRGELINRRKNGSEYVESVLISPVRQADGKVSNYLSIKENITEQKQAEERIQQLAHFDVLTGLPNQTLLKDYVAVSLQAAKREGTQLAVLFLDIDHFKNVNDTLGHRVGDALLVQLAARMKALVREQDTLSRMGGDEFILVLPDTDAEGAASVAAKILSVISQTCQVDQYELVVTPSIGISVYPGDGENFERLYQNADVAMYRAKQDGRNTFRFFTREMQALAARRLQLENALRHALSKNQFEIHYQPQISMQDGRIVGAEALLRWNHPELGQIPPSEFIPVAEESGLILSIGAWVLEQVVSQAKYWVDAGYPLMTIAVNLSAVQFRHAHLPELVLRLVNEAGLPASSIELELTESVAMDDPLSAIAVMDELHGCGIRMSIDDFGTGYSSLSYLRKFKVNKLKIDQSFVSDLGEDEESRAIVTAIITLAVSMGFQTIAEGVETAGQLAFLRLQGCDEVQGYYFSKPLEVAQFEAYLREQIKF